MSKKLVKNPNNEITIDFSNRSALLQVMNTYGNIGHDIFGMSSNRESMVISIHPDKIVANTYQRNGWVRQNVYHRDGETEELFLEQWEPEVTHSPDNDSEDENKAKEAETETE